MNIAPSSHVELGRPAPTEGLRRSLQRLRTVATLGRVVQAGGTLMRATGVQARVGQSCRVFDPLQPQEPGLLAEVIGFQGHEAVLAPLGSLLGVPVGAAVEVLHDVARLPSGRGLLGRVIDAFGQPLDGGPPLDALPRVPLYRDAPSPLQRRPVHEPLVCGVRAIDALLTVGEGQRVGIFAMAGGGKSTLLGMLARSTRAEVNVIGLIGERGREVREFLEDSLGPEGLARSVVVVSTSDRPALERVRAAHAATAIAEGFRAEGARVVLMMGARRWMRPRPPCASAGPTWPAPRPARKPWTPRWPTTAASAGWAASSAPNWTPRTPPGANLTEPTEITEPPVTLPPLSPSPLSLPPDRPSAVGALSRPWPDAAVSYTHLTLPTKA